MKINSAPTNTNNKYICISWSNFYYDTNNKSKTLLFEIDFKK